MALSCLQLKACILHYECTSTTGTFSRSLNSKRQAESFRPSSSIGQGAQAKPAVTSRIFAQVRCRTGSEQQAGNAPSTSGIMPEFAKGLMSAALCLSLASGVGVMPAEAKRPEGVNKPELLPQEFTRVIDVAGFLSSGQEERIAKDLERLEGDTGFKLRVLAQNYPDTPGLAIREYWGVDDSTVVMVADPSLSGNILNFNVGAVVDLSVPRSFWSRLSGKYGNMFWWREHGEDASIEAAVVAIDACLREPAGPRQCADIKGPD